MGDAAPIIHQLSEGGIVAEHAPLPSPQALVATSNNASTHNTIKSSLVPFACWRAGDMRFDFESSFIRPEIAGELGALKVLIDQHTLNDDKGNPLHKPGLTVFGHADPTGNDDFNKALSGRRAQAIYGMLTRRTELWEELFNNSLDHWGKKALGTMLDTLSSSVASAPTSASNSAPAQTDTPSPAATDDSAEDPEREKQLTKLQRDGGERKKLFKSYMDLICRSDFFRLDKADQVKLQTEGLAVADRLDPLVGKEFANEDDFLEAVRKVTVAGELAQDEDELSDAAKKKKPFVVDPKDFLGGGTDPGGKGDFQGCGEFNPVFLQAQKDIDQFNQVPDSSPDKPLAKADRDAANEPDRRVLIFLFRAGLRISPDVWPCPRVKEGTGGCRKRFFSDGDKRRNTRLPDLPRKFDETKDTFACRFYDRMSNNSPCEQILTVFRIRLFDRLARPLPNAPFIHNAGGVLQAGRSGEDAFITLRDLKVPATVNVKWSRAKLGEGPGSPPPKLNALMEFSLDVFVAIPNSDSDQAALNRLQNLGYTAGPKQEDNVRAFKNDYKTKFPELSVNGKVDGLLDVPTKKVIRRVHDACDPVPKKSLPPKGGT